MIRIVTTKIKELRKNPAREKMLSQRMIVESSSLSKRQREEGQKVLQKKVRNKIGKANL